METVMYDDSLEGLQIIVSYFIVGLFNSMVQFRWFLKKINISLNITDQIFSANILVQSHQAEYQFFSWYSRETWIDFTEISRIWKALNLLYAVDQESYWTSNQLCLKEFQTVPGFKRLNIFLSFQKDVSQSSLMAIFVHTLVFFI